MNAVHDDRYVLFVRFDEADASGRGSEKPVASCSSYEDARRLRRQLQTTNGEFVIRYIGPTGGGD